MKQLFSAKTFRDKYLAVTIAALFISTTSFAQVKVGTSGAIEPIGAYPAMKLGYYQSGAYPVTRLTERDSIPSYLRTRGMIVRVSDDSSYYTLKSDLTTWNRHQLPLYTDWSNVLGWGFNRPTRQRLQLSVPTDTMELNGIFYINTAGSQFTATKPSLTGVPFYFNSSGTYSRDITTLTVSHTAENNNDTTHLVTGIYSTIGTSGGIGGVAGSTVQQLRGIRSNVILRSQGAYNVRSGFGYLSYLNTGITPADTISQFIDSFTHFQARESVLSTARQGKYFAVIDNDSLPSYLYPTNKLYFINQRGTNMRSAFGGLVEYKFDISSLYTARSLVDKAYVDNAVTSGGSSTLANYVLKTATISVNGSNPQALSGSNVNLIIPTLSNPSSDSSYKYRDTIRAFGNSFTEGAAAGADRSYPARIDTLTGGKIHVNNYGISSQTSTQILTRLLADSAHKNKATIIEMGRNNYPDTATVMADIATAVNSLGHNRYLILNIFKARLMNEWAGTANAALIDSLNARILRRYTYHVVPINEYIISLYNPSIPQDVLDHGHNIPPSSLSATTDSIHRNPAGYDSMAHYILNNYLNVLEDSSVITSRNIDFALSYPPNIGYGKPANGNFNVLNAITDTSLNLFVRYAYFKNLTGVRDGLTHLNVTGIAQFSDSILIGNLPSRNASGTSLDSLVTSAPGGYLGRIHAASFSPFQGSGGVVNLRASTDVVGIGASPAAGIKFSVAGNVQINGNITPVADNTSFIGTTGENYNTLYSRQVTSKSSLVLNVASGSYVDTKVNGTTQTLAGGGGLTVGAFAFPATSSVLDVTSTTKGALLPRMTKTQRDAISTPAVGLIIYQTDNTPGLRVYNGTNWMKFTETAD